MAKQINLLLVENDIAVREALARVLVTENYRVLTAGTCDDASLAYTQNDIDIVLLDLNLGTEDGWNVFHMLKGLRPELPIIVISAQPERFVHASANEAHGALEKPFDMPALVCFLKQAAEAKNRCAFSSRNAAPEFALPTETGTSSARSLRKPTDTPNPSERRSVKVVPSLWHFLVYSRRVLSYTLRALSKRTRLPLSF